MRAQTLHFTFLFLQGELSDGIAMLVAGNDRIQAIITQMEEICKTIEVSIKLLNLYFGMLSSDVYSNVYYQYS